MTNLKWKSERKVVDFCEAISTKIHSADCHVTQGIMSFVFYWQFSSSFWLFGLCSHTPNQSRGESVDIYTFKVAKTDSILCNCYTRVIYHQFFNQIKGNYIYYYSLDGYTMKIPSSALNTVIRTSFNNLFPDSCVCFFWNVSSPNCILNTCHPLMLLGV